MTSLHVCAFLITFPVSFAGLRNAGSLYAHRMQRTPPPPPPGHRGIYRVPTGILTRATYHHQAAQPTVASQPQRGVFQYAQPMTQFTPQPVFPPQPPSFHPTTFHRAHPAPSPHQRTPHSFTTPPLPNDFVPSEHYHDCKVVYGYDLPKAVKATTYIQKLGIAGCPIETVPLLAIVRHSWSSYWLRYLCHGHEIFPVFTKHISQAMLATELFSRLNHNKIDLDTVALAHCQGAIPPIPNPTKKQALAALADEFYEYMSGLIHETPSQHTTSTDQQSNQRILQLEQQLATTQAQLAAASGNQDTPTTPTKKRPPPSPSPTISSTPPPNPGSKTAALPVAPSQATPTDTPAPAHPTPLPPLSPLPVPSPQNPLRSRTAHSRLSNAGKYRQPYQEHQQNLQNLTFSQSHRARLSGFRKTLPEPTPKLASNAGSGPSESRSQKTRGPFQHPGASQAVSVPV